MEKITTVYLIAISVFAFATYGVDKFKAKRNKWRISEKTLILLAFLGGAPGALAGMIVFRHKTLHWKFRILVPLALVLWIALILWKYFFFTIK